jgi:nucleoside-diphosphate-sugar epimerase
VGRERVCAHFSKLNGTPMLLFRLSYAIDLRYGVLMDVAQKVWRREPVDVTMGYANVIWQGDANARAIQCLQRVASPAVALNVTGLERVSIRELAMAFGERLGKPVEITGQEAEVAWLFDASRSYEWFGPPRVSVDEMVEATAAWVVAGGETLGKPTHFEVRDGAF